MNKTLVVTGVAGFIGSHVARALHSHGHKVVGIDDCSTGCVDVVPTSIEFIQCDLSDPSNLSLLPEECYAVLHLAGQSSGEISFEDPLSDLQKNAFTTLNLIQYCKTSKAKLIVASSMSVYGDVSSEFPVAEDLTSHPLSCYGIGKSAAESYMRIHSHLFPTMAIRMFNVYGPGQDLTNMKQGMVSIYVAQALKTNHIDIHGSLDRLRDFIYIDDITEIWCRAAFHEWVGHVTLNAGCGVKTSVRELVESIQSLLPHITYSTSDPTPGDQNGIYASTTKLTSTLGPLDFISLQDGLHRFISSVS